MLERDPELIVLDVLLDEWPADAEVGTDRISDGWWDEADDDHQVTVTHYTTNVDGETGYNAIGPDGTSVKNAGGSVYINVWIAYTDEFPSMGEAKDLRWETEKHIRRAILKNAQGTEHNGARELQSLGWLSVERSTEADGSPTLFRSRIRVAYSYFEHL